MLHRSRFFDFFPPPNFLAMSAAGLDISDQSVRFTELSRSRDQLVVKKHGEKKIPTGVVSSGEIQKPEILKNALRDLQLEHSLRFVRVSLPEEYGYLIKLELPSMKSSEIRGSLELQLEEHIPISPANAVFDYEIIACGDEKGRDVLRVGLAVMPRRIVKQYIELFSETGLVPVSFELEAHALARVTIPHGDCKTFMVVDIGATRTGIFIVSEGIVRYTATISVGGNTLTDAVSKAFGLDFKKGREQKEKYGLRRGQKENNMFSILAPAVGALRDEINRRYSYWHTLSEVKEKTKIEKIFLCGGEANVPGLLEYLDSSLAANVELVNPWLNISSVEEFVPKIHYDESLRYAVALGLSLRSYE